MKYLGIDYGSKRIGVAVSDESAILAFPLGTIAAGEKALREVLDIIKENDVKFVVMGESLNFSQEKNPIMKAAEAFAEKLQDHQVPVIFEPEFLTSALALRQTQGDPQRREKARKGPTESELNHDASAAALILQSYLDRMRKAQ